MEEIEEILIQADVGVNTTLELMDNVREVVREKGLNDASELAEILKQEMLNILGKDAPISVDGGTTAYDFWCLASMVLVKQRPSVS